MDLRDPKDSMRAFRKTRASAEPEDTWTWFAGSVTSWEPGGRATPLFGFEGYNVARAVDADGGFDLLTREAVFYTDLRSGEVLRSWRNPLNERDVEVVHIWNDPVNFSMRLDGPRGPWRLPTMESGDDVYFSTDVFLAYPSPLPRAQFPDNSQDDLYQAVELFGFFTSRRELEDDSVASASCRVSWTRIAPWLPWMEMADRPGQLVYHGRGRKFSAYEELPARVRAEVDASGPHFAHAPEEFTQPNETSWTAFRKRAGR